MAKGLKAATSPLLVRGPLARGAPDRATCGLAREEEGGLRERKKAERRTAILEAARTAFNTQGFDAASIEAIAATADVSVGTVYNYFPGKSDLLFEILLTDLRLVTEQGRAFISRPSKNGRQALISLLSLYFEWFDRYERSLLRRFTADAILSPSLDDRSYYHLERLLSNQIATLIRTLRRSGELRADLKVDACARLIFNLANSEFYAYLADDQRSSRQVRASLRAQTDVLWPGLASAGSN